jgi:hypothetical protein
MKRVVKAVPIGDGWIRFRLNLEDDPSTSETAGNALIRFIQTIAQQPLLLRCGPGYFTEAKLSHGGSGWSLRAEAVAKDPQSST